jgi:hypothetical protein
MHFLWLQGVHSLGTPDPLHILPVLAAVLTFIQLRMAMPVRKKPVPGAASDPTAQATQTTMYLMPVMTLFFGWSFFSGLALYWCISTLFSAVQQYFLSGWGSLFVGIPGMEHLVPEPKDTPGLAVAGGAGTRAAIGSPRTSARALAAPTPEPPAAGGIRGMFRQLRETMAAAQSQAAERGNAAQSGRVVDSEPPTSKNGTAESSAVTKGEGETKAAAAARRQRTSAKGPVLVKPASNGTAPKSELPEQAIARDAVDEAPGEGDELPEVALARDASGQATGTPENGVAKRAAPPPSARPANAQANPQRKNSGNNGKGASSARSRNGRPKGGR